MVWYYFFRLILPKVKTVMQYIVLVASFHAIIAIWLLWLREKKTASYYLLICLLIAIALHLTIKFSIFVFIDDDSIKQQMNTFVGALYGPLIYLYTLATINKDFIPFKKWYLFIPFFILMIGYFTITCLFIVLNRVDQKVLYIYNMISLLFIIPWNLFYALKSLLFIRRNKSFFNHKQDISLIAKICYCLITLSLIGLISEIFVLSNSEVIKILHLPFRILAYLSLYTIILLILRENYKYESQSNNSILENIELEGQSLQVEFNNIKSYDYSLKYNEQWNAMDNYVRQNELFRDCDLNLDELASHTGINKYQISEMLNSYKQKPFYKYINEYRIEYFNNLVTRAIKRDEELNFLLMAYESGFNSKSSFNRYFKEIMGTTPSNYYKKTYIEILTSTT